MNYEELLGAIARGWCTPVNEKKVMDSDLAVAIAAEVVKYLAQPEQEPYGYVVYFPTEQRQEYCDDLDELIDDTTNLPHEITPLYTALPMRELTDAEIDALWEEWKDAVCLDHKTWAQAVLAAARSKT